MNKIKKDGPITTVYNFDKYRFNNLYNYYYLANILFWIIAIIVIGIFFGLETFYVVVFTILLLINLRFYKERRLKDSMQNSVSFVYKDTITEVIVFVCWHRVYKEYSFSNVLKVKQNIFYIKVKGNINVEKRNFFIERSSIYSKKHMYIMAYYENMDEIYASLIKFKERTADKQ